MTCIVLNFWAVPRTTKINGALGQPCEGPSGNVKWVYCSAWVIWKQKKEEWLEKMMLHDNDIPNKTQGVDLHLLSGHEILYENPLAMDHPDSTTQFVIFSGLQHNHWFSNLATQETHLRKFGDFVFYTIPVPGPPHQRFRLIGIGRGPGFSIF